MFLVTLARQLTLFGCLQSLDLFANNRVALETLLGVLDIHIQHKR